MRGGGCMLKEKRFWLAAVLLLILLICIISRAVHRAGQPEQPRQPFFTTTAEQTQPVTETTQTVTAAVTETETTFVTTTTTGAPASASEPYLPAWKAAEMSQRVEQLSAELPDFIGWLYLPETDIDYPVVQGTDNFYYLTHAPDGRYYALGTIFLDYRNARDFTDPHNILFGHNMQSGMFGAIRSLKDRAEFDRHRYGWLFTPDTVIRIDFFALAICSGYDAVYDVGKSREVWLERIRSNAMYDTGAEIPETQSLIALSTCASDFEDARALFTGTLNRLESPEEYILQNE